MTDSTGSTVPTSRVLAGQVAVVTGASRGIGRQLALTLSHHGATVAAGARDRDALAELQRDIEQAGGTAWAGFLDVSDGASIDAFVHQATHELGGLDIVVNNAGILTAGGLLEDGDEPWARAWETNVLGTVRMTRAAGRVLTGQRHGKVINVASNFAFKGVAHHAAYCASKAAIVSFTKSIAVEWARYNIQVNAIAPGFVATELNADIRADDERSAKVIRSVPARRFGSVEDVSGLLMPLCDPQSTFITGAVFVVDGGETAR